jgi:hypothetical protein
MGCPAPTAASGCFGPAPLSRRWRYPAAAKAVPRRGSNTIRFSLRRLREYALATPGESRAGTSSNCTGTVRLKRIGWPGVFCPECVHSCGLADHAEKNRWRHLNTMHPTTEPAARLRCRRCPAYGAKTIVDRGVARGLERREATPIPDVPNANPVFRRKPRPWRSGYAARMIPEEPSLESRVESLISRLAGSRSEIS